MKDYFNIDTYKYIESRLVNSRDKEIFNSFNYCIFMK